MHSAALCSMSQRGMTKAISFTGSNRSEAMTILKYYLANTTPREFYDDVGKALSNRMILSTDVENFLSGLEGIGVVTSSAHIAVRDNVFRHRSRCHQPYMECDNGPRSCNIPHIITHTIPAGTEVVQAPTAGVACCEAALSMSVTPTSAHFHHTTSLVENVEYNPGV